MRLKHLVWASLFGFSTMAQAALPKADALRSILLEQRNVDAISITETQIKGLYEVLSDRGVFYSDATGRYIITGEFFDAKKGVNLTEQSLSALRKERLAQFEDDMIVYPAKNEKYTVTVFTDTNCGYCRKLHNQIHSYEEKNSKTGKVETKPGYTDLGITVRYLAYPRGGEKSSTYKQMVSVWCADDKVEALNKAKSGKKIKTKTCENTVLDQYNLGDLFGVRGTPALILEDGSMIPGYKPPTSLLAGLEEAAKK